MNIVLTKNGKRKDIGTVRSLENIQDILEQYKELELYVFPTTDKEKGEGEEFYARIRKELDILSMKRKYL